MNHVDHLTGLVDPFHRSIAALASEFHSVQDAYHFVRDNIAFDPSRSAAHPAQILRDGSASCLGKCVLLCSLYRAMGVPADDVRIVTGELALPGVIVEHAWIDMELNGRCLQQDPTTLLGLFGFGEFAGRSFSGRFVRRENYCFNDRGLAIVSQLNRLGDSHPVVP